MTHATGSGTAAGTTRRFVGRPGLSAVGQAYGAIAALVLLILFNAMFTERFLSMQSLRVNLSQVSSIIIVAT